MIEGGRFPDCSGMTGLTSCAFCTGMNILGLMAAEAGQRCTLEFTGCGVAVGAQHTDMCASQFEGCIGMIKGGRLPNCGSVTSFASCSFGTLVHILRKVAAHTGRRGTFKVTIGMALGALQADMRAGQLERELVVIKIGDLPGSGGMAGTASCAENACMNIILLMAAHTGHRGVFELEGCGVTIRTQ